jgi:phytoene dehydrogenase-like protein
MERMNSSKLRTRYDAVIIGSGHNGLVAAAYLAKAGQSVLVLERSNYLGGATASQRVFRGYDALLSRYSYLVSLFPQRIIEELGLRFETRRRRTASFTPYTDARGVSRGLVLSNVDMDRSKQSLEELTGSSAGWRDYQRMLQLESVLAGIAWPSMLDPLKSRSQFQLRLTTADEREAWTSFVDEPLGNVIERHATHDVLRGLLMTDGKIGVFTHPHDPSLLQNRCFLYHVIGNGTGEWRVPVGGMQSLVRALIDSCRGSDVTYLTDAPATAIHEGPASHTVCFTLEGVDRSVDATRVLVNAGPRTFARLLGDSWTPAPADEGSVIKINMLLHRLPRLKAQGVSLDEAFSGSFHLDEGYEQMKVSYQAALAGSVPNPAPGEMYCHTLTDDSILSEDLRRRGFQTLTLFGLDMPYRLFRQQGDSKREAVRRLYLEGLDRVCSEPFQDCIARDDDGQLCLEIKTPQNLEEELDLDLGNIFHRSLSWFFTDDPSKIGTWGVETSRPRIYRAGSSAERGGAVSGIPGRNAAMCILEEP